MTELRDLTDAATAADPRAGLRAVRALGRLLEHLERTQVDRARAAGWSWQEIADVLGVSRQAVHKKHARRDRSPGMFERFTRNARAVVVGAQEVAHRHGAPEVRPAHLLESLASTDGILAMQVLADLGAPGDEVRRVVRGLGSRYSDVLDAEDAEALRLLGIDLDDVIRRIDQRPERRPRTDPARDTSGSPARARRSSSCRCARRSSSGTASSAPSTSCSASCGRATARPWRP